MQGTQTSTFTIVAVFDNRPAADAAIAELHLAGVATGAIHLGIGDPTGGDSPLTGNGTGDGTATTAAAPAHGAVGNFLHTLFGTDNSEHVQRIDGAVTHSHLVLTVVAVDAGEAWRARSLIGSHRPVSVDGGTAADPGPGAAPAAAASAAAASAAAASAAVKPAPGPLSQLQAEPPGRAAAHEASWRSHHAQTYGAAGADQAPARDYYDEYAPAYLYGLDMATHEQHGGKEWDEAEPQLRGEWERRHPQSAWERFREAVKHGWERLRSERAGKP
ncbi:MAG: hypothetical protein JWP59_3981 [Massilia sp.]|nr:hypothetical protein [Massilia sp.]